MELRASHDGWLDPSHSVAGNQESDVRAEEILRTDSRLPQFGGILGSFVIVMLGNA